MRVLVLLFFLFSAPAHAACRHALVLALDISGSVNAEEYLHQANGLANALLSPEIQELILAGGSDPVEIAVFEWSSEKHQDMIVDWTPLTDPQTIARVAERIRAHRKNRATLKTAIGSALNFARLLLEERKSCWRRTIDVSGDGKNNDGPRPQWIYENAPFEGIVVNALVVSLEDHDGREDGISSDPQGADKRKELQAYYNTEVVYGPDAFSIVALGYADYERAMRIKLIRELSPLTLSQAHPETWFGEAGMRQKNVENVFAPMLR